MKTGLKVIAWVGLTLVILGLAFSFSTSLNHFAGPGSDEDIAFFFAACLGYIGAVVALVSSIISKPRFFGTVATIVGLFYIFSFYGYFVFVSSVGVASKVVLMVLPGVALIGGGIVLARISSTPIAKGKKGY